MDKSVSLNEWTGPSGYKYPVPADFWGFPVNASYSYKINPVNAYHVRKAAAIAAGLVGKGFVIEAIKQVRIRLDWGLIEAGDFVDDIRSGKINVIFSDVLAVKKEVYTIINEHPPWSDLSQIEQNTVVHLFDDKAVESLKKATHIFGNDNNHVGTPLTNGEFQYSPNQERYIKQLVQQSLANNAGWIESAAELLDFARRKGYTQLGIEQAKKIWQIICEGQL